MAMQSIIIADDDDSTRKLLQRQLERAGYTVTPCADGRAAFDAIREQGEGIVVADWGMPEMDGPSLCRALREMQAMHALRSVHVILLTARTDQEHVVEGLESGADDYLTKPYHHRELLARIRSGQRTLVLQQELYAQRLEVQKANAALQVLNARLEKLANTDTLTGLFNRRVLFERLNEAWAYAQRIATPLSAIMLDIDHFKKVNDTHGHHAGDVVLSTVAALLRKAVRPYDTCARFGGEEFVVICPDADGNAANDVAERLRRAIERAQITVDGNTLSVTVSVGAAVQRERHSEAEALISEADAMLYEAKGHGRNQVWYRDEAGQSQPYAAQVPIT
ncbi:MAG: diguanylate cyclase [Phycisphaerae bacterium]|nr:diguanylate cyclase [Phycisphaerae bacterium]